MKTITRKPISKAARARRAKLFAFVKRMKVNIDRGVRFLDSEKKDWFEDTKLDLLDLQNTDTCMAGQVFEGYFNKFVSDDVGYGDKLGEFKAISYAFNLNSADNKIARSWDILTALWVAKVAQLRLERNYKIKLCKVS